MAVEVKERYHLREELIEMVKAAGQDVIDNAEDLVGGGVLIDSFSITLNFPIANGSFESCPTIDISRSHVSKRSVDVMLDRRKDALV